MIQPTKDDLTVALMSAIQREVVGGLKGLIDPDHRQAYLLQYFTEEYDRLDSLRHALTTLHESLGTLRPVVRQSPSTPNR